MNETFSSSVHAIYSLDEQEIPYHVGSCVLIEINQKKYILTAAHIVDEEYLHVLGHKELIEISGSFCMRPQKDRNKDHFDFAWSELSEHTIEDLGDVRFISNSDFLENTSENDIYIAKGYPRSKNKKINNTNKTLPRVVMNCHLQKKECPKLLQEIKGTKNSHIFLHFDHKSKNDKNGIKFCEPKGMSGGALIHKNTGKLAGLLIEHKKKDKVMVAVNINLIEYFIEKKGPLQKLS
jgi:hypothetical protein